MGKETTFSTNSEFHISSGLQKAEGEAVSSHHQLETQHRWSRKGELGSGRGWKGDNPLWHPNHVLLHISQDIRRSQKRKRQPPPPSGAFVRRALKPGKEAGRWYRSLVWPSTAMNQIYSLGSQQLLCAGFFMPDNWGKKPTTVLLPVSR